MTANPETMVVLGTRPEIIKFSPLLREFDARDHGYVVVHTGQHYSDSLDAVFFEQLELSAPEHNLGVGSGSHGRQTGEMMMGLEPLLRAKAPTNLLVQGDTNSALAGSLVAAKRDVVLGHVEAGLRSGDREMPEEINRVVADHVADLLFAPTETSKSMLLREDRGECCRVTGNTVVDAVYENEQLAAEKSTVLRDLEVEAGEYALLTAHREENVDHRDTLVGIMRGVAEFADGAGIDCVYPVHPRARDRIDALGVTVPDPIRLVDPLDYLDFLQLEREAGVIFTDSGGVQEEACILQVPCVTVRTTTERPESVDVGANVVVGTDRAAIAEAGWERYRGPTDWSCPFGDGRAAERIVDAIEERTGGERA